TGIAVEIPYGYEGEIRSRSGIAKDYGVFVLNSPGTIDSDYRGEVRVILMNLGDKSFKVNTGDRIAQLVISPVVKVEVLEVDELSDTGRNAGGFGHTGRR
ncbi:MAG TPA: dUTP diphosphatase, partial [bacterium]|nr:dUTP diphosphatase [bacterium]